MCLSIFSSISNETVLCEAMSGDDHLCLVVEAARINDWSKFVDNVYKNKCNALSLKNVKICILLSYLSLGTCSRGFLTVQSSCRRWTVEEISTSIWNVRIDGELKDRHLNQLRTRRMVGWR
ncbi:unnamed protein product [Lepeophtheirus salmonis]|uniref:(salmon louse) hypothetical protein n=1 Tax=Lepeophtheirus salmonis TaxID=72036 RepID=A0A817F9A7_LEPSM|nr:unnamed protein product [Lepeophtheirus salmonis]CAG9475896.1 unnamed protein product [Lepeophtheirus salmonis]